MRHRTIYASGEMRDAMRERLGAIMRRARRWGGDLVGVLAAIAYAAPSLWYPFAGDQGLHWYLGRGILLGEVPYTNAISSKPPLVFVVHALGIALFGDRQSSIRIIDLLFVLGAGVLIASFRRRVRGPSDSSPRTMPPLKGGEVGAACLLVSGLYYTFFDFNDTAHPTLWQGVALLASAWVITRAPGGELSGRAAFGSGALACCAVTLGHDAALAGVVLGAAAVFLGLVRGRPREALRSAGAFTGGVVLILAAMLLPFLVTDTVDAFWNVAVEFVLYYAERASAGAGAVAPWLRMEYGGPAVLLALALATVGFAVTRATRNRGERRVGWWVALLMLTTVCIVVVKRRALISPAFNYYFMLVLPFLALMTHWGLRQPLSRRGADQLLASVAIVVAAFFLAPKWGTHRDWSYRAEWGSWLEYVQGERTFAEYHAAHYRTVVDSYVRQHRVGYTLAHLANPGDTMCADGFVPILYYLSGLRCTSRSIVGDIAGPQSPLYEEHQRAQRDHPPTFIVTFSDRPPRIRELQRRGYVRRDVDDGRRPYYVILERSGGS